MFGDVKYFVPGSLNPVYRKIVCADGKFLYAFWKGVVVLIREKSKVPCDDNERQIYLASNQCYAAEHLN